MTMKIKLWQGRQKQSDSDGRLCRFWLIILVSSVIHFAVWQYVVASPNCSRWSLCFQGVHRWNNVGKCGQSGTNSLELFSLVLVWLCEETMFCWNYQYLPVSVEYAWWWCQAPWLNCWILEVEVHKMQLLGLNHNVSTSKFKVQNGY